MKQTVANLLKDFASPPEGYGPIPFWFWNDELKDEDLLFQLHEMYDKGTNPDGSPKPKTSHSLARVPFVIFNGPEGTELKDGDFGLANVAATVTKILGFDDQPAEWLESINK